MKLTSQDILSEKKEVTDEKGKKVNEYRVEKISLDKAREQGKIVGIADHILFREIRRINEDFKSQSEKNNDIKKYREEIQKTKHRPDNQENYNKLNGLTAELSTYLYVPALISVVMSKEVHKKIAPKGFYYDNKHYVRYCASSGNLKNNTVLYIDDTYLNKVNDALYAGQLNIRESPLVVPEKFGAYAGLVTTGTLFASRPRVCVIPDFQHITPNEKVRFVSKTKGCEGIKYVVDTRDFDQKLNSFDGMGLISLTQAQKWCAELEIDTHLPSAFNVRAVGIKGLLVTMDFHEFAEEHQIASITDISGRDIPVSEIDVILTESQWKMHSLYNNDWTVFDKAQTENNHVWGVQRCSPQKDNEYIRLNYQLIQTSGICKDEDIENLLEYTKEHFRQLASGDKEAVLSLLMGENWNDTNDSGNHNHIAQAIIKDPTLTRDPFVCETISRLIHNSLHQTKLGKIWAKGNYSYMISDPYALCEWACFRNPKQVKGLLKPYKVYSRFWLDRKAQEILACRSPMTDLSEHNLLTVTEDEHMKKYYRYINSGIIYSIHDLSTVIHSDSDFDSDMVLTTDNQVLIDNIYRDKAGKRLLPVTYQKGATALPELYTEKRAIQSDCRGFGNKVGSYSNRSTNFFAMLPLFSTQEDKQKILDNIAILRLIIGEEIDSTKTGNKPTPPSEYQYRDILSEDDIRTRTEKENINRFAPEFPPYFFRYKYHKHDKKYAKYFGLMDIMCRRSQGMMLEALLNLPIKTLTEDQRFFLQLYKDNSPLILSECAMNKVCWKMETFEKEMKAALRVSYPDDDSSMLISHAKKIEVSDEAAKKIKKIYRAFRKKRKDLTKKHNVNYDDFNEKYLKLLIFTEKEYLYQSCRKELYSSVSANSVNLFNSIVSTLNESKDVNEFIWLVLGKDLLEVITQKKDLYGEEYCGLILWQDKAHAEALLREKNPDKVKHWAVFLTKYYVYDNAPCKSSTGLKNYINENKDEIIESLNGYLKENTDQKKLEKLYEGIKNSVDNPKQAFIFFNDKPIKIFKQELDFIKSYKRLQQRQRYLWVWLLYHKSYNNRLKIYNEWVPIKDDELYKYSEDSSSGEKQIGNFRKLVEDGTFEYKIEPALNPRKYPPECRLKLSYAQADGEPVYVINGDFERPILHLEKCINEGKTILKECACGNLFEISGRKKYCETCRKLKKQEQTNASKKRKKLEENTAS